VRNAAGTEAAGSELSKSWAGDGLHRWDTDCRRTSVEEAEAHSATDMAADSRGASAGEGMVETIL